MAHGTVNDDKFENNYCITFNNNPKPKKTKFSIFLRKNSYAHLLGKTLTYIYVFLRIYHTTQFFLNALVFQKRIFTNNCVNFYQLIFLKFLGFYFTYFCVFFFFLKWYFIRVFKILWQT